MLNIRQRVRWRPNLTLGRFFIKSYPVSHTFKILQTILVILDTILSVINNNKRVQK